MLDMVAGARLVGPDRQVGAGWRAEARSWVRKGPGPLESERLERLRYHLSDRLADLRDPRTPEELIALGVSLYDPLAELLLRGAGQWTASGKWIPRRLFVLDPHLAQTFSAAFSALFAERDIAPITALAESAMAPFGGVLFEGYEARRSPSERSVGAIEMRHRSLR
jgi:hypothetical protein